MVGRTRVVNGRRSAFSLNFVFDPKAIDAAWTIVAALAIRNDWASAGVATSGYLGHAQMQVPGSRSPGAPQQASAGKVSASSRFLSPSAPGRVHSSKREEPS
jgi:hypothetical protein